jgi:hypothetical protein
MISRMPKRVWFAGESVGNERPVWAPLLAVVGALADRFMWMYEVVLDDGRSIHAYKHCDTRRYLHLGPGRNAWGYRHRQGRNMYRTVDLAGALIDVFGSWDAKDNGEEWDGQEVDDGRDDWDGQNDENGRGDRRDASDPRDEWGHHDDGRFEMRAMVATVIEAARVQGSATEARPRGAPASAVAVEIDAALIERARVCVPPGCRLTDEATVEHAIAMFTLDRELLHGGYRGVLCDADAGRMLLDELHQTGRDAHDGAIG